MLPEMFFARLRIESSAAFGAVLERARMEVKRVDCANGRAELSPKRRRVAIRLMMCGLVSPGGAGLLRDGQPWCCVQRPERNLAKPASAASIGESWGYSGRQNKVGRPRIDTRGITEPTPTPLKTTPRRSVKPLFYIFSALFFVKRRYTRCTVLGLLLREHHCAQLRPQDRPAVLSTQG